MNIFLLLTISIAFGIGTFLILRRDIIKMIIGIVILSHSVHMMIVAMGAFDGIKAPIIEGSPDKESGIIFQDSLAEGILAPVVPHTTEVLHMDPLVQAIVLTAIVINLAITAFLLILAYRIYEEYGTMDADELRRLRG
ncbi:multisubunit sodium/proton antiporter, MrpC subunit (2.A.63.1) [Methanosalsum zhilinae DSM 4017]|uniref:Multisubunit sodium/proton antiporter, MrpC subunit (2.A.63.1) n=1 Tax=Methanosalsum zhilinae (strain DSM 4017 / NBRC 107636 / OCM 62 / WeN5) TaxID=679901 RepID=F7XLW2_METZD|nr:NADH-quinone oxidoreductase subunit K [Methanosalsum zhilinae]AEH60890.1 multisubunit sodium/proton antiporter, MrpC subunit (2.A.63.1) [Methanosalsum zhilinae DSM 4017]